MISYVEYAARAVFEARKEALMPAIVEAEKCNACKSCEEVCPTESIKVVDVVAVVKEDDCIDCNLCMDTCPSSAITMG